MIVRLFLNDLSVPNAECAIEDAVERLRALVATLRAVGDTGASFILNAERPIAELSLGSGYPLAALRNARGCEEERVYLKTLVDRAPWTAALAERGPDKAGGADYQMTEDAPVRAGIAALALGLAHDLTGMAISMPTHAHWRQAWVPLLRVTLNDQGLIEEPVEARNSSGPEHVEHHRDWLQGFAALLVEDGAEIWARRAELFPHLHFVHRLEGYLIGLRPGHPALAQIMERLLALEGAIAAWSRDCTANPTYPFYERPESRTRIRKGYVDLKDDTGTVRTFSRHLDYPHDEGRIHFILETEPERRALVGHIGRKLGI